MESPIPLKTHRYLAEFSCLGAECEDTCCKGWGMQLDAVRYELYQRQAPELLEAVTSGEAERILRRDPTTDYCVKFEGGLCSIHKERGTKFLGDACHFYPRVTRQWEGAHTQAAALSCPEITRRMLFGADSFAETEIHTDRVPVEMKRYVPEGVTAEQALGVMRQFLAACDDDAATAEQVLMRLLSSAFSLQMLAPADWPGAAGLMLRLADMKLPAAEIDFHDGYRLVQILQALIGASKATARPRLNATIEPMLETLQIRIAANDYSILSQSGDFDTYRRTWEAWQPKRSAVDGILKRWLKGQLVMASFPFAGFGGTLTERAVILAVRFATLRLALMCAPDLQEATIVRVVQSLARFLDHLADPALSLMAYQEAGWTELPRLRGLVMD